MTESGSKINPSNANVNTRVSIADITTHVIQQKALDQFYNPKTDQVLLDWSKQGKFTLASFTPGGFTKKLIFKNGVCTEMDPVRRKSKFYPKKNKGN